MISETECRMLEELVRTFGPMTISYHDADLCFRTQFQGSPMRTGARNIPNALHALLEYLLESMVHWQKKATSLEKELEQLKAAVLEKELEQLKKETP